MEETTILQATGVKAMPNLEEKLAAIIEARELFLARVLKGKKLENGYDTNSYNKQQENIGLSEGNLLNISTGGLFISWDNFFAKLRGDHANADRNPYAKDWYASYNGTRPINPKSAETITPKWELIVDKKSTEKFTHYLFEGSYLCNQEVKDTYSRRSFYNDGDGYQGDILKLNRPLMLFFDGRGLPHLYIFTLPGLAKEVTENAMDENFVIRIDDFDTNYLNNLFLMLGGIYYGAAENKRSLRRIAKRAGSSTFSSLIAALDNKKTEAFYSAFLTFNAEYLKLKAELEDKKHFLDKYINLMFFTSKIFRNEKRAHFRLNAKAKAFVPNSLDNEYSFGEMRKYIPTEIFIKGDYAISSYGRTEGTELGKKEYYSFIKPQITPTRKKFFEDFGAASEENAAAVINKTYENLQMYETTAKSIEQLGESLNSFANFVCNAFSSVLFLNISEK